MMVVGVLGSLVAMALAAFIGQRGVYEVSDRAASERHRLIRVARGSEDVMQHMLNEEAGLRGYLASGGLIFLQPYSAPRDLDDVDVRQMLELLPPDERTRLGPLIARLHEKCDSWQDLAASQISQRRRGPIEHVDLFLDEGR